MIICVKAKRPCITEKKNAPIAMSKDKNGTKLPEIKDKTAGIYAKLTQNNYRNKS